MKKRNVIGAALLSMGLLLGATMGTAADGRKVLTLGANLSEAQEEMMLNYFGVTYDEVDVITITNEDEREHLGAYVPLEQIGKYTFSCALVSPTTSGGIKVKTANLDWVTANMIATTLSTSGVVNCEVIAASPIQVSGTGALTGIIMAYEEAMDEELDAVKKELATQELVITGQLANSVGQKEATAIVNEVKTEIISQEIKDIAEIQQIIVDAATANQAEIAEEEISMVAELMEQIAQEDYDYEEMKDTLARVEENVSMIVEESESSTEEANEETESTETTATEAAGMSAEEAAAAAAQEAANAAAQATESESETEAETEESILDKTNDAALGEGVISGSTQERETEAETEAVTEAPTTEAPATEAATEAPATEAATEAPATEAATEAPATEAATEAPATEAATEAPATEAATEAPATEATTEAVTEAVTEAMTEEAYTVDMLDEEQKEIYDGITWYVNKLFAQEVELTEEEAKELEENELYKEIEELVVTEWIIEDETVVEELLKDMDTFVLTMLIDGLTEEGEEPEELDEEAIEEYGVAEVKALCEEVERILADEEEKLFVEMEEEAKTELKETISDEWKAFLRKLYEVDPWEEEVETETATEAAAAEAAAETAATEAAPEETTEAAATEAAPEETTEAAATEAAPEETTEAAATEAAPAAQ